MRRDGVVRLGNLCLLQGNATSGLSNINPLAKRSTFQEMIAKGSLKLREMARPCDAGPDWRGGPASCRGVDQPALSLVVPAKCEEVSPTGESAVLWAGAP